MHIEVDIAGASSSAPHRARVNFDVGCVESCSSQRRLFSTLRALNFAPPQLREMIEKPNGFSISLF